MSKLKEVEWMSEVKRFIPKHGTMVKGQTKFLPSEVADKLIQQKLAKEVKKAKSSKEEGGKK